MSFFEIYNDKIYDLLRSGNPKESQGESKRSKSNGGKSKEFLDLREEKDGYFTVADLKKVDISTIEEAYQYLD